MTSQVECYVLNIGSLKIVMPAIQAALSGSTITATINSGNQISYASATLNQTANTHGFRLGDANGTIDNFTVTA